MIRAMQSLGYQPHFIGRINSVNEAHLFTPYEQTIPEGTPMMLTLNFETAPSYEALCTLDAELSKTDVCRIFDSYVCLDDSDPRTIHIVYTKGLAIGGIIGIIAVIAILPIILGILAFKFMPDSIKNVINAVVTMGVLMLMMRMMSGMIKDEPKKKKPEPLPPPPPPLYPYPPRYPYAPVPTPTLAPTPHVEQRIADRVESIANSIARIGEAFSRSKSAGATSVVRTSSEIGSVARDVNRIPDTEMSKSSKAHVYDRLSRKQRGLVEQYDDKLTPRQRQLLQEERQIVEELRAMYD